MEQSNKEEALLYLAYRKLKSHIYYDSSSLFLRKKLAHFEYVHFRNVNNEADFKQAFRQAFLPLINYLNGEADASVMGYIKQIGFIPILKTVEQNRPWKEKDRFITNIIQPRDFKITKCNALIDAPIELHVLSVLWLITVGKKLNSIISTSNYAYRLSLYDTNAKKPIDGDDKHDTMLSSGLMLFEPYFIGYQQWRDNAIRKAEQGLDEKKDVTMLSLDIRRYFYSIRMDVLEEVNFWIKRKNLEPLDKMERRLCTVLQQIHYEYAQLLNGKFIKLNPQKLTDEKVPLPVGLLSSGFLGNLGLSLFDDYIHQTITPSYYGRYVDDILMVFAGKKIYPFPKKESVSEEISPIDSFIQKHLIRKENGFENEDCHIKREVNSSTNDNDNSKEPSYYICFRGNELEIQSGKVLMEYFKWSESRAAINKFKKKLQKNRSEFRLLPFESEVNKEFDDAAFKLEYSDSINRIRDIRAISEDKYGASKYLAQKIFLSVLPFDFDKSEKEELKKSADQILTFFRGVNSLQMYVLWEKVATYFVINSDARSLKCFYNQSIDAINEINEASVESGKEDINEDIVDISHEKDQLLEDVKKQLADYLHISLAMALSLDPTIFIERKLGIDQNICNKIEEMIKALRASYLFRHNYQYLRAYCYTLDRNNDWRKPLLGKNLLSHHIDALKIDVAKYLAPIFLHMQDIALICNYNNLAHPVNEQIDSQSSE